MAESRTAFATAAARLANASRRRKVLIAAASLAFALRLGFGLGYWVDQPLTRDEREYLSLARSLAAGRGFDYDEEVAKGPIDPFGRAPGYPVFLALVGGGRHVASSVPTPVKVAQSAVGAAGVLLVGILAGRLVGPRAANTAAILAAAYPPLVWVASYAWSEAISWPLGLLIVWLFDRAVERSDRSAWRLAAATGLVTGMAVLIRPAVLLFVPLAIVWLLWRRRLRFAAALVLGVVVVLAPWTARNVAEYGRFVLVATEGGVTFWTGNHPRARGEGDLAANPHLKLESQSLRAQYPGLSEEAMEPVYYREALAWIQAHPFDWLRLEARKVFYLVVPIGPSYTMHSRRYYGASVISYGVMLPLAVIGLFRLGRRRARTPGVWLLAGSAVAVCLIFFPQERFRIPVIDPVLIICASAAFSARGPRGAFSPSVGGGAPTPMREDSESATLRPDSGSSRDGRGTSAALRPSLRASRASSRDGARARALSRSRWGWGPSALKEDGRREP